MIRKARIRNRCDGDLFGRRMPQMPGSSPAVVDPYSGYIFYDNFLGTGNLNVHTPEKGGAWTLGLLTTGMLSGGSVTISRSASNDALAINAGGATANGTYTFSMSYAAALLVFKCFVNYADGNNHWRIDVVPSTGNVDLVEVTLGASTTRASCTFGAGSTSATVVIVVNGDNIQATVSGGTTANYTVAGRANKTATGLGIGAYDNFVLSEVSASLITQT